MKNPPGMIAWEEPRIDRPSVSAAAAAAAVATAVFYPPAAGSSCGWLVNGGVSHGLTMVTTGG